jgi:hypothetical protein
MIFFAVKPELTPKIHRKQARKKRKNEVENMKASARSEAFFYLTDEKKLVEKNQNAVTKEK